MDPSTSLRQAPVDPTVYTLRYFENDPSLEDVVTDGRLNISVPQPASIVSASLRVGTPDHNFPESPILDIGDDGEIEWKFNSDDGRGLFGEQTRWIDNTSTSKQFQLDAADSNTLEFKLPIGKIEKARIEFRTERESKVWASTGQIKDMIFHDEILYIASEKGGLLRYDLLRDSFEARWTTSTGFPSNTINSLAIMGDILYAATEKGVVVVNLVNSQILQKMGSAAKTITIHDEVLYVGRSTGGVSRFSLNDENVGGYINSPKVQDLLGVGEMIYLATLEGVLRFNTTANSLEEPWDSRNSDLIYNKVRSLATHEGLIYMGTDVGVSIFNTSNGQFMPNLDSSAGLEHPRVRSIHATSEYIYIATDGGGVYPYDPTTGQFREPVHHHEHDTVDVVYRHEDRIYVGGNTFNVSRFAHPSLEELSPLRINHGPSMDWMGSPTYYEGILYLTTPSGINRYDFSTGEFLSPWPSTLFFGDIRNIAIHENIVYIMDINSRIEKFNLASNEFEAMIPRSYNINVKDVVFNEDLIFISTYMEIAIYNTASERYDRKLHEDDGFPDINKNPLATWGNFLYVGSKEDGMAVYNISSGEVEYNWTTEDGLLSNDIQGLQALDGVIYIKTSGGLSRLDTSQNALLSNLSLIFGYPKPMINNLLILDGILYAAKSGTGVARYNLATDTFEPSLAPSSIYSPSHISQGDGILYILTPTETLRYDLEKQSIMNPEDLIENMDLDLDLLDDGSSEYHQGDHNWFEDWSHGDLPDPPSWQGDFFVSELQSAISSVASNPASIETDDSGNPFVTIPIGVSSSSDPSVKISGLNIHYDYSMKIDFTDMLNKLTENHSQTWLPLIVPLNISSANGGSLRLFELTIQYFEILDYDGDNYPDHEDWFPHDPTQWSDVDGDGFGDNPRGNAPDYCPLAPGNVTFDTLGCPDGDNDGLSDDFESSIGTDPSIPDTDNDTISDGDEWKSGTNPLDPLDPLRPPQPDPPKEFQTFRWSLFGQDVWAVNAVIATITGLLTAMVLLRSRRRRQESIDDYDDEYESGMFAPESETAQTDDNIWTSMEEEIYAGEWTEFATQSDQLAWTASQQTAFDGADLEDDFFE